MNTHPEQWAAMLQRPGSSWGFGALLKDTSVMVLKEERALVIHSLTNNPCRTRDSNPQPLDYESNSLTLGHDFPYLFHELVNWDENASLLVCLFVLSGSVCVDHIHHSFLSEINADMPWPKLSSRASQSRTCSHHHKSYVTQSCHVLHHATRTLV